MMRSIVALSFLLSVPTLVAAERLLLSEISTYLNSFRTAEAKFVQINDDGTLSSGMLYIKRPGRLRIEYDLPDRMLVVAGGGAVVIFDPKSNSGSQTFPLRRTPLSIILARTVDLENADMVTHHEFDGESTIVTAQDPQNPQYGNLRIIFSSDPIELSEWVVTDGAGEQTMVYLQQFQTGKNYSDLLFDSSLIDDAAGR
ncbi:MAG: outer membrane lipoprotein carrier protein LolA [Aestuariivita sp.]|nr:outer membrane lipoprotein carrier protein LolA [Aestuariivita sp.]